MRARKNPKKLLGDIQDILNVVDRNRTPFPYVFYGYTPFDFAHRFHKAKPKHLKCYGEAVNIPWERAKVYGEERPWTLFFVYVPPLIKENPLKE
ncbi:hypothetical protein [Desulforamulus reducens]|uniref:hypothetical protein n=1 Tax=Desulforamulus reducens TaxID=59610 RepID=UPI00059C94A8|nr:hypothetical protein [Desulforamulus reducens]